MALLPKAQPGGIQFRSCSVADCGLCSVRDLSFCAALEGAEIERLNSIVSRTHLAPQQMLFIEGDPADYLFNVTAGTLKLYKLLPDGRRQITGFLSVGDFLGLATNEGYSYSAEAVTDVELCRFPRRRLELLFNEFPQLEKRIFSIAIDELAAAQEQMLLLGRKTAVERMASFLLTLSERAQHRNQTENPILLPMTRSDIGDYLGLTIETVSRTLSQLKRRSLIELSAPNEIELVDSEALRELAEG